MIRLFQFIIFGHWHKWAIHKEEPYEHWSLGGTVTQRGRKFILRCENCGEMKAYES